MHLKRIGFVYRRIGIAQLLNDFARARREHLGGIIQRGAVVQLVAIRDEKQSDQAHQCQGQQERGKVRPHALGFAGSRDHLW